MLTLADAARRPEVRAVLAKLDGVEARTSRKAELFDELHKLVGPADHRSFAVIDLVLNFYTCDLTRGGVFRRNKVVL